MAEKVRKLEIKGAMKPTENRKKAERLRQRKAAAGIKDCLWTVSDASTITDDDVLADL